MLSGCLSRWLVSLAMLTLARADQLRPDVTGNIVLTSAGSPWEVNETVYVLEGASLTVEAGVTVLLGPGVSLMVYGQFVAEGTPIERVQFAPLDPTNMTRGNVTVCSTFPCFCVRQLYVPGMYWVRVLWGNRTAPVASEKAYNDFGRRGRGRVRWVPLKTHLNNLCINDNDITFV